MANVGTAASGKTLVGAGSGVSPTFVSIGTNSGLTAHGILIAEGNGAFVASTVGTNGQVLIGANTADPAFATITSNDSSITFTTGTNTLNMVAGGILAQQYVTNSGTATPSGKVLNVIGTGTNGIATIGSGNNLTIGMSSPFADGNFIFQTSTSGTTRQVSVANLSNTAASNAELQISVAGTSAGNAYVHYGITAGTQWSTGTRGSNGNYYITTSSDLTTGVQFTMNSSGAAAFTTSVATPSITLNGGTPLTTYIEGTWTPILAFGGASTGITYGQQTGSYVRTGKTITIQMTLILSSKGSATGAATISGLPVNFANLTQVQACAADTTGGVTLGALNTMLFLQGNASAATFTVTQWGSAQAFTALTNASFANNGALYFTGTFLTV